MTEDAFKRTAKNFISLVSVRVFDVVYMFLVMAILARYFGPSLYGDYAFINALVFIFLPFINFGVTPIMVRELSVHPDRREEIFGAGLSFRALLALVTIFGIIVVIPLTSLSSQLATALLICVVSELSLLGVRMCAEIFTTFEKMELETYLGLSNRLLSLGLLLTISHFDLGFLAVFIAFAGLNSLTLIAALLLVRGNFLKPRLVWRSHLLWFWIKEALPIAISFGLLESFLRIDILVLRVFRDPSEIAYFDIAYKIIYRIVLVASVIAIVLSPAMARLAHNEMDRFRRLVEQGLKILLIIAIPATLIAHLLGPFLIVPCFGTQFRPAESAMATLSWCLFFSFFEPFLTAVLISIKRAWWVPLTNGIVLVVNLVLDLLLIPSYGFIGASYANIGAYFLWFILSLVISSTVLGALSLRPLVNQILPMGLAVAIPLLAWHHLNLWVPWSIPRTFFQTAIVTGLAMILYIMMLIFFKAMTWQEISTLRESLGNPHHRK
jgi:O-antigen/teichoic acid export membrane protein